MQNNKKGSIVYVPNSCTYLIHKNNNWIVLKNDLAPIFGIYVEEKNMFHQTYIQVLVAGENWYVLPKDLNMEE